MCVFCGEYDFTLGPCPLGGPSLHKCDSSHDHLPSKTLLACRAPYHACSGSAAWMGHSPPSPLQLHNPHPPPRPTGDQFALMESVVALAVLARRFDVAVPPDAPEVGMTTGATIHTANGLWLNVRPRSLARQETSVGEGEVAGLDTSMLVGK